MDVPLHGEGQEDRLEHLCGTVGSAGGRCGRPLHDLRQMLRGLPDGARGRSRYRPGRAARRRAQGPDLGRGAGGRPAEMAERLRRQRALQRCLPGGHQCPPMGDHRQDEVARGRPSARGGRRQRRQPLPPHGAGRAAARQHAAAVGDLEEDPGAGRAAHRRGAVLYRLQRAAHAAHRAERHGHPRRARARLRRGRRHRPLLRRLPVPGSRPADLRAHGPSHLPALRPVGRLEGADLVPDLHQEFRRAGEGRRGAVVRPRPHQRISWPPTSTR